MKSTSK